MTFSEVFKDYLKITERLNQSYLEKEKDPNKQEYLNGKLAMLKELEDDLDKFTNHSRTV